jgi:hypothetical protein
MSQQLISRSTDLVRLRNDGYDISVKAGYLVMRDVPYLTPSCSVARGVLISQLDVAGDQTVRPTTHVVSFAGESPSKSDGAPLQELIVTTGKQALGDGLESDFQFSHKPAAGYANYYEKMTTYANILVSEANIIDPDATAMTFPVVAEDDPESPFEYIDTASSRAQIGAINDRLRIPRVAIVGLGGTGSYILDLVAKAPVWEIHLYDGDLFLQHNAFRSPGAPSRAELAARPQKVDHFAEMYSKMRRNIVPHPVFVDDSNVDELTEMDFVFLALDGGDAKRLVVDRLTAAAIPFVDVGMGIYESDDTLAGLVATTTSSDEKHDHVYERIPFSDGDGRNEYTRNIQIADLNALNAAFAVIKWKKLFGVYSDLDHEHYSVYVINDNSLVNDDSLLDDGADEDEPPLREIKAA